MTLLFHPLRIKVVFCEMGITLVPVSEGCYERESGPIVEGIANRIVSAVEVFVK